MVDRLIRLGRRFPLAALSGTMLLARANASAQAAPLASHQWQNRPLLIFATDRGDQRYRVMMERLAEGRCDVDERDMVIGEILSRDQSRMAGRNINRQDATEILETFGIAASQFAVLLVGKDGGEKLRRLEPLPLAAVFALIDTMPMRQREARRKGSSCDADSMQTQAPGTGE